MYFLEDHVSFSFAIGANKAGALGIYPISGVT